MLYFPHPLSSSRSFDYLYPLNFNLFPIKQKLNIRIKNSKPRKQNKTLPQKKEQTRINSAHTYTHAYTHAYMHTHTRMHTHTNTHQPPNAPVPCRAWCSICTSPSHACSRLYIFSRLPLILPVKITFNTPRKAT